MDLWIRTQSDGLHQIIGINEPHIQKNCVVLIGYSYYKHIELGTYKTKERALEVLDEIQEILKPQKIIKFENRLHCLESGAIEDILIPKECLDYNKQLINYVYEMPRE